MNKNKTLLIILSLLTISSLVGCSNEEKEYIDKHTQIVRQATEISKQNVLFGEYHMEEQELYEIIISEGEDSINNVQKQMENALTIINQSKELVKSENDSLLVTKTKLDENEPLLSKLRKSNKKSIALKLDHMYKERMTIYQEALNQYDQLLDCEEKLYVAFQNGAELKEVSEEVDHINEESQKVRNVIQQFNKVTQRYNQICEKL
ncbi:MULTISPECIES: YkyA family protein [Bacillus]|uniref:YkyA family protein n=1 Tax=Bacillus TaxID=1386 RepID=UPI000372B701|nr:MULTISPECIES: YkyA family protein [Bacillus]